MDTKRYVVELRVYTPILVFSALAASIPSELLLEVSTLISAASLLLPENSSRNVSFENICGRCKHSGILIDHVIKHKYKGGLHLILHRDILGAIIARFNNTCYQDPNLEGMVASVIDDRREKSSLLLGLKLIATKCQSSLFSCSS